MAGKSYTFDYPSSSGSKNIYLIAVANSDNANIRFTYWADNVVTMSGMIGISVGGVVFLTILSVCIIYCLLNKAMNTHLGLSRHEVDRIKHEMNP